MDIPIFLFYYCVMQCKKKHFSGVIGFTLTGKVKLGDPKSPGSQEKEGHSSSKRREEEVKQPNSALADRREQAGLSQSWLNQFLLYL